MKNSSLLLWAATAILSACSSSDSNPLRVAGLRQEVEVLRDSAGVNHIYAKNEHDLFFAQGYCAARDRLFQFEVWRRQATGTVSEILGPGEFKRDVGARLFAFRGDLDTELNHYHPRGKEIISAFTDGINAYVRQALQDTSLLPLEFRLLGIKPGIWEPRDVISRHQGLLGNLPDELRYARAIATVGEAKVKEVVNFEPGEPDLKMDVSIDQKALFDSILAVYDAFRATLRFKPEHLPTAYRNTKDFGQLAQADEDRFEAMMATEKESIGSNNWIVSGARSASGKPLLANDPHRTIAVPSLRYMVHLNAPGWNVVGGGEPTIPGVSIGHNEYAAWGLTIFNIDGEDLYVYELNPDTNNQYRYQGAWEDMTMVYDTIPVEGEMSRPVIHRYTRHGPVVYIDSVRNLAYAARCAWLDVGAAPYLASLRIDQATTWEEFREGCSFSRIPGENMIWADTAGNIGWQAVGVAPVRTNFSGLVPVPGDGRYEWAGYLPIPELPHVLNPESGYLATANENNVPAGYPHRNAVGWNWADPFRVNRIYQVLASRDKHTLEDMAQLQVDYFSLPARTLVPLLAEVRSRDSLVENLRSRLLAWNLMIDKNSVEAAVYVAWEKKLVATIRQRVIPTEGQRFLRSLSLRRAIGWITGPGGPLKSPAEKQTLLLTSLEQAVDDLKKLLGDNPAAWVYGQQKLHHVLIKHPMSNAVDEATRAKLEVGPLPRSGYASTPGVTSNSNNQSTGASFRIVADLSDWDKTMFTNAPGQSGDPESPYYENLFRAWAEDRHFPVFYTRDRVQAATREKATLIP